MAICNLLKLLESGSDGDLDSHPTEAIYRHAPKLPGYPWTCRQIRPPAQSIRRGSQISAHRRDVGEPDGAAQNSPRTHAFPSTQGCPSRPSPAGAQRPSPKGVDGRQIWLDPHPCWVSQSQMPVAVQARNDTPPSVVTREIPHAEDDEPGPVRQVASSLRVQHNRRHREEMHCSPDSQSAGPTHAAPGAPAPSSMQETTNEVAPLIAQCCPEGQPVPATGSHSPRPEPQIGRGPSHDVASETTSCAASEVETSPLPASRVVPIWLVPT